MNFIASPNCMKAATSAADGKLTVDEVMQAFDRLDQYRKKLEADGQFTGRAERIRKFAEGEAERAKIAAAMAKRQAALNVLTRKRLDTQITGLMDAGVKPQKAMLAVLEGTTKGVQDGRKSVAANVQAYEARYLGSMLADLQREKPHLVHMLRDEKFDRDVMTEMSELRDGGKPGRSGNRDAQFVAKTFSDYAELARTDLNKLGASIGKLDGWAGPQSHDDIKMIQAGKDAWVGFVAAHLDGERTFPDGISGEDAARALGDIYDTIITGISNDSSAAEKGQRVKPANLARSLGKSRVLHFKDAEAAIAYRDKFGYSNTVTGMFSHLRRSAKVAGAMETLGPNPEIMFNGIADTLKRKLKADTKLSDKDKTKIEGQLTTQAGALRDALDIATGLNSRPVNVTLAKIGSDIRAQQSMAKLGGAVISSFGDTITAASASQFRGSGFLKGIMTQWAGVMRGRPRGEQAEIAYLIGEGFDGLIGHITNPSAALDGPIGMMGRWQEKFFRWNGLTWWTDVNRAVAGRTIAAELGMRLDKGWDALPPAYRHVLSTHGFTDAHWRVMQKASLRMSNGKPYLTPDRIRALSDEDLAPLGTEARRQLELQLLRFYADETSNAVIEPDARSRRTATLGTRPGTFAGEAVRMIMQFKSYPIAFTQRVGGRLLYGNRKDASFLEKSANIGTLLAGLTVAGYMSMTAKDVLKGYWPPRDPTDPRTMLAAAQQGGAWGIYGDYLFSQNNRFGGDLLSTAAGPTLGNISDLINIGLDARDAALSGGQNTFGTAKALSVGIGNVPYANLFWVKPALDYLFLNSLREAASPGYLRKTARDREKQYGQTSLNPMPPTLAQTVAR